MSTRSRQQFDMIARMGLQNYIQLQSEAAEGVGFPRNGGHADGRQ